MSELLGWWLFTGVVIAAVLVALGAGINERYLGIFIDSRNKMSLSRFQLVLWSWLLISSFWAVALATRSMGIEMSEQLWALMGISIGSASGTAIVQAKKGSTKASQKQADDSELETAQIRGLLMVNEETKKASILDIFKGEELTDYPYIDIGKVQMFFFTIAAWLGYAFSLWSASLVPNADGVINFPALSTTLVTLVGISHAGYLTIKAVPKT